MFLGVDVFVIYLFFVEFNIYYKFRRIILVFRKDILFINLFVFIKCNEDNVFLNGNFLYNFL